MTVTSYFVCPHKPKPHRAVFVYLLPLLALLGLMPLPALASEGIDNLQMTSSLLGILALVVFVIAYGVVMLEEFTHMRKSKPVILGAAVIWVIVALLANQEGVDTETLNNVLSHNLAEYAALFLFLLTAMTYINAMTERGVFDVLRVWLLNHHYSYRKLFWISGILAFFISPIADNLTTALLIGAVVMAVGANSPRFIAISFVSIVVAANAGGAFSPFGDITTLMVWQANKVHFTEFFVLFIPALVNYLVPAVIMHFFIPDGAPPAIEHNEKVTAKRGATRITFLFVVTIALAISFKQFLNLPPFMGMMAGLSLLMFFGYYLKSTGEQSELTKSEFNIYAKVERAEWDTLLFFFGIVFCVGGLGYIGYLAFVSHIMYDTLGATSANIIVGVLSAIVDNIPVMFAVLRMDPEMDLFQWLLVTFTAGVGGSMLSIGSAAGVALMGQSQGQYTFFSHLKWTPVIMLGYIAGIGAHYLFNA